MKQTIEFISKLDNPEKLIGRLSNEEIAVLYSGGGDSLLVADVLGNIPTLKRIHLITYDNGANSFLELAGTFIPDLKKRYGEERIIHRYRNITELFRNISLNQNLMNDILNYGNNYLCVGCKLAMHSDLVAYSLLNGIGNIADGYNNRQNNFPEQTEPNMQCVEDLAKAYGIRYHTPILDLCPEKIDRIHELGIRGLHTHSVQPTCLFGASFKNLDPESNEEKNILDYIGRRSKAVCSYIDHIVSRIPHTKKGDNNELLFLRKMLDLRIIES